MDFLPDKEFNKVFKRTSKMVNFKGAGSPAEINNRLDKKVQKDKEKISMINEAIREGWAKGEPLAQWKRKIRSDIRDTRQLMFAGFARRTIDEAIARPDGMVSLTLKYGRKKAKDILLERSRQRIGTLRVRKHGFRR